jgi:thiamine biosynthesis lipoprotein
MKQLFVDPENAVATRLAENISIDLGGIGKGYISDKMADILEEWEINSAMINCGGSTILALDPPQGKTGWGITCDGREFNIRQGAVSASGLAQQPNHIVDHHTLKPPHADTRTWTMAPTAAIADALSTAAMLMPDSEIKKLQQKCPEIKIYH